MAYNLSYNKAIVNEGDSVIITLDGTGLPDGSLVPFTISGTNITETDFLGFSSLTGNFNITGGRGRVVLNIAEDLRTEGPEAFILTLTGTGRTESIGIFVNDVSLSPSSAVPEFFVTSPLSLINEGDTLTFNITGINVPAGTAVPYEIFGLQSEDLVTGSLTGTVVFTANSFYDTSATVSVSILEDFKTEGNENAVLILKPPFPYSLKISSTVVVFDSSTDFSPAYIVTANKTKVTEGDSITFTTAVKGLGSVNVGTPLYWSIRPTSKDGNPTKLNPASDITVVDFVGLNSLAGTTEFYNDAVLGNIATVTLVTRDDYIFEPSEYFLLVVNDGKLSPVATPFGTTVYQVKQTNSPIIELLDSGNTLIQSDSVFSGNLIVSFEDVADLKANIGGITTDLGYWKNSTGLLSDEMVIQGRRLYDTEDSPVFYQPFSYVIKSSLSIDIWSDSVKDILHPAGFSFFSEINNETDPNDIKFAGVKSIKIVDSEINTYSVLTADKQSTAIDASTGNYTADKIYTPFNF